MRPPVMPEDGHTTRVTSWEDVSSPGVGKDTSSLEALWDDEDNRAFYKCLSDLRAFVPSVFLGETEPKLNEQSPKTQEQPSDLAPKSDKGQIDTKDTVEVYVDSGALQEDKDSKGKDKEEKDKERTKEPDKERRKEKDAARSGENEKDKVKGLEGINLDALLQRHLSCVEFCYLNSKANMKELVRALFNVPRTSLELLPYYSRMVATLSTCMKDIRSLLLQLLEEEFNFLINKKLGHYKPTDDRLHSFLSFLKENGVNLDEVEIQKANDDYKSFESRKPAKDRSATDVSSISDSIQPDIPYKEEKHPSSEVTKAPKAETKVEYKRTLSGGLQSPEANVPQRAILQRINSKRAASSHQLGQ